MNKWFSWQLSCAVAFSISYDWHGKFSSDVILLLLLMPNADLLRCCGGQIYKRSPDFFLNCRISLPRGLFYADENKKT